MPALQQKPKPHTLRSQKYRALLLSLGTDPDLANALLVTASTLFILLAFKFYPLYLLPLILLVIGFVAYRSPVAGTILNALVAFPAIIYQTPILAWIWVLLTAVILFQAFEYWHLISVLIILILAPFAPEPVTFLGGIVIPLILASSLMVGSKKSLTVSVPAVYIILLLSALWGQNNGAFLALRDPGEFYAVAQSEIGDLLQPRKPFVEFFSLGSEFLKSFAIFTSFEQILKVDIFLGLIVNTTIRLFIEDSALLQLLIWAAAVFLAGFIPGRIRSNHKQVIASLSFLLLIVSHILAIQISKQPFNPLILLFVFGSIAGIAFIENKNINLARELSVIKAEKARRFGKFGIEDLSASGGAETLDDIGNYEDVKTELTEAIIWPLRQKELTVAYGIKPPNGLLLFGPPGTGKTMLMRALAKELEIGFYYVKCSEILSEWYGESEKNISELFTIAKKNAPCILFFDEIDSIGKRRDSYTSDDVSPRVMSLLLSEMDGFKGKKSVMVIGATNVPNQLDPALLRPGRFDKIIYMQLPDKDARAEIFEKHARNIPIDENVDFDKLAEITQRYSGADIANICIEAARKTAREAVAKDEVIPVTMDHFLKVVKSMKPSVSLERLDEYEKFQLDFERRSEKEEKKEDEKKVSWDDVVGLDDVRKALAEAIEIPLLHEDLIKEYKIIPSKGLLLFGPPGCGKTLIVKAAASELKATFISLSGAEMLKRGYDGAISIIKETFNRARENAPAVIFMDEIEAMAPARGIYGSHVVESVVAQLLTELDGLKELKSVMLIGATNKPAALDPAILRPGRFDKIMFIPPPDEKARKRIFEINLTNIPSEPLDFEGLSRVTEGFTGADITSICQEAKMLVVRYKIKGSAHKLTKKDLITVIKERRPSVSVDQLQEYLSFLKEYGERR
ncbi:AAA family ATPase [Candidatus Micrarchaeota archaeon]|nr:AAA family ATPase [Candidatus Micrarchaeota archaeon]